MSSEVYEIDVERVSFLCWRSMVHVDYGLPRRFPTEMFCGFAWTERAAEKRARRAIARHAAATKGTPEQGKET